MRHILGLQAGGLAMLLSALLMATACNVGDTASSQPPSQDEQDEDTGNDPDPDEDTGNDPDEDTGNDPDEDTGNDPDEDTGNDPDEDTGNDPDPAPQVGSVVQQSAGAQNASSESYQLRLNMGAPTAAPAESTTYKLRPAVGAGN